jgi:hypothetical protein
MEGTKDADAARGAGETTERTGSAAAGRTREEQATSDKTLADLERTQAEPSRGGPRETGSPTETSSPAPDGVRDGGGRADGSDTGGPM